MDHVESEMVRIIVGLTYFWVGGYYLHKRGKK